MKSFFVTCALITKGVTANIDNLVDLKRLGRKLDTTFWYKYQNSTEQPPTRNRAQISEIRKEPPNQTKTENQSFKTRNFYRTLPTSFSENAKQYRKPSRDFQTIQNIRRKLPVE